MKPDYEILMRAGDSLTLKEARMVLRRMLIDRFGRDVKLGHLSNGAPTLSNGVQISISHSRSAVVLLLWDSEVSGGVDIEDPRRNQLMRVAPKFLSHEEMEVYNTDELRQLAWTAKEAVYKAAFNSFLKANEIKLPLQPVSLEEEYTVMVNDLQYSMLSRQVGHSILTIAFHNEANDVEL